MTIITQVKNAVIDFLGISLTLEQWDQLTSQVSEIDDAIAGYTNE